MYPLRTFMFLTAVVLPCTNGYAAVLYGWDQGTSNNSRLSSYPSAVDIASNTNLTDIGFNGSHIWSDIATDGVIFYGWRQGTNNDSRLTRYPSASDLAANTNLTNIGFGGSHVWDAIATDGNTFFGYRRSDGRLTSYPSAENVASNSNLTNIGFGAKTTFTSIATDGIYFYGWVRGTSDNSVLYRYGSAIDFATDTNALLIGSSGSHIWDAIAAATVKTWTGTHSNMQAGGNWTPSGVPNTGQPIRFNGGGVNDVTFSDHFQGGSGTGVGPITLTGAQTAPLTITNNSGSSNRVFRLQNGQGVTIEAGAGALTFGGSGDAYQLVLGGSGSHTFDFVNQSANVATIASNVNLVRGGSSDQTVAFSGTGDWRIDGPISNAAGSPITVSVTKSGVGTLSLNGNNTYTGGTTVSAGTLLVNNTSGSGTGTGAVLVEEDGVLGGTGIIGGATTIADGGVLSPGTSIGRLTFEDTLTLAGGSKILWEFDGKETAGVDYDLLLGLGDDAALYLPNPDDGRISLSIFGPGATLKPGDSFTLFDGTVFDHNGEPLAFGDNLNGLFTIDDHSGWRGTWKVSAGSLILTAVPEPGTWLLLLLAFACGLLVRQREKE